MTAGWIVAALALTAALIGWRHAHPAEPRVAYDRFHLPGFDSYVYVAMGERPSVFTVSPWGYRLLTPLAAGRLSPRNVVRGLRHLTWVCLVAAGGVLLVFLLRRGHEPWSALLGVAAFGASPPVARIVEVPFFVDPLAILLMLVLLVALEARAGRGVLALLGVLLAYAKDPTVVLTLAPAAFAMRCREGGPGSRRAGLLDAAALAIPAALTEPLLRAWWTPQIPVIAAPLGMGLLTAAVGAFLESWTVTASGLALGGLMPLAILGGVRRAARDTVVRYGVTLAALVGMALFAWVRVPSPVPVPLFGENVQRVLVYALPLVITLALVAVDRFLPSFRAMAPARTTPRASRAAGALAVAALLIPLVALDRYRRLDLQGSRDGPLVLAFCRETWRTATRLAAGETATFTPESHRFAWGESDVGRLSRMRWFLREGWGGQAHYGVGQIVMHEHRAALVLPLLEPRDVEVTVTMSPAPGTTPLPLSLACNGRPVSEWIADAEATPHTARVPKSAVLRGDNLLTITSRDGRRSGRLRGLSYRVLP